MGFHQLRSAALVTNDNYYIFKEKQLTSHTSENDITDESFSFKQNIFKLTLLYQQTVYQKMKGFINIILKTDE